MGSPYTAPGAPLRRGAAFLLLLLAVALLFHRVLLGEGVLYFRDVCLNHLPTRIYTSPLLRSGHLPLWNPYLSGGLPLAANPNNLIFHPITLLFLILPALAAFQASILLQYLIAGWGMLLWGREEGLAEESALAGALTYVLAGPLASCGSLQNLLCSWAWIPLALFALARHRRRGSRTALLGFAAALAVQLLAGDILAAGTTLALGLVETLWGKDAGKEPLLPAAGRLGAAFLLGCGLALIQILPAREMLAQSSRSTGISYADASVWSLPPARLLEMVVPSLYGDPTALKVTSYWGGLVFPKGYPFLLSVYLGAVPLLLALCALGGKRDRRARSLGVLAALFILTALGSRGPLYRLFYLLVPLASSLRYPSRFMLPALLCLSMLAALGLERLREGLPEAKLSAGIRLLLAGSVLLAGVPAILALAPPLTTWLIRSGLGIPGSVGPAAAGAIASSLRGSLLHGALMAAGAGAAVLALRRARRGVALASALALLALGADSISANSRVNPVVPAEFYDARPLVQDLAGNKGGQERVYPAPRPPRFAVMARSDSAWWGYYWDEVSGRVSTSLPHKIWMAFDKSTDLLSPRPVNDLADRMPDLEAGRLVRLTNLASVGILMSYRELEDPGLIPEGQVGRQTSVPLRFYRSRDPLPRAYLVSRALPERGEPLAALTDPGFDPRSEVYLAAPAEPSGAEGPAGSARIRESLPEKVVVEVSAKREGWLVLTDNYYPGWVATREGKRLPILRANYLFRAVRIPEGESRIVFSYRPRTLFAGAAGSLAALAVGILYAGRRRRPRA